MEWLFGKQKTPKEMLRDNQRALNKAIRELDRERANMQKQEKKVIQDIKKAAKDNQMGAAKIMAKDLVRTRKYITKFYQMRTQLQAVGLRIQTLRSNQAMAEAMMGCTKAMRQMNQQLNLPQIQAIMFEFEKQSEIMDMKEEMFNDAIDDVMASDNDSEEEDEILNQVLDEIGVGLGQTLDSAPVGGLQREAVPAAADSDLLARLDALRKSE